MVGDIGSIDQKSFGDSARERAVARLVRARLYIAPLLAALALTFAFFEPAGWRRAVLSCSVVVLFVLSYAEWARHRAHGMNALTVPLNLAVMMLGQIGVVFASGGLFSPLVPAMVMFAAVAAVFAERRTVYLFVDGLQVPAIWCMAVVHAGGWPVPTLMPQLFGSSGAIEHGAAPWLAAAIYTALLNAAAQVGGLLRTIFTELFEEAIAGRDRALAMHAEQARALTALSAELAHELKNPLASVKGLSALVARDVTGKAAERLAVLRGEVDRMQGILEELLDFSRPLVPLTTEDVDLAELVREVARLHEATAVERAVALRVHAADPVHLRCDPRKVRQVLINLVQNAFDASPRGMAIDVEVSSRGDGARVAVADRGRGIEPAVAQRLFEPGVTSKEHGTGLGLVVARSLARQHGGELVLEAREGGGARALLTLPNIALEREASGPSATPAAGPATTTPLPEAR